MAYVRLQAFDIKFSFIVFKSNNDIKVKFKYSPLERKLTNVVLSLLLIITKFILIFYKIFLVLHL